MLHNKLGQRICHTLLAAIEHDLWADENFLMTPEVGCLSGGIATIWATACDKEPHTTATRPGEHLFLDILYPIVNEGIKKHTSYANYLIIVGANSRYIRIYCLASKSSKR
jgi:hypothetical protein